MNREDIRSVLRDVGACGESNDTHACILPTGHGGLHGYEVEPEPRREQWVVCGLHKTEYEVGHGCAACQSLSAAKAE